MRIDDVLIHQFLESSARRYSDKQAAADEKKTAGYGLLEQKANGGARFLVSEGLKRGDRVAVCLPNCIESVVSLYAVWKSGGVAVPVDFQSRPGRLMHVLRDSGARFLITSRDYFESSAGLEPQPAAPGNKEPETAGQRQARWPYTTPAIRGVLLTHPGQPGRGTNEDRPTGPETAPTGSTPSRSAHSGYAGENGPAFFRFDNCFVPEDTPPQTRTIDIDLASLLYTSGSTGSPKGVMLTHLNMVTALRSIASYLGCMEEDRVLSCLALSFDYGLYQVLLCSLCGATVILRNSFCFPNQILSDLRTERASAFPVLPTMVSMLARFRAPDGAPLDNIRYITNTGQKLTSSHIGVLKKLFPNARIFSMYGLTECKRATYLPPEKLERKPDSVGQAIPNTEAWLIDEQGNRIETPDTEGQLVIRGSHVMKGYWNKPDETARALHNGALPGEKVLYTGDYFTMDDEGDLYFVTRHDDLIKTAGHRIGPGEIEVVVSAIHGVSEAAAVGIDDPVLGQAVAVFLVAENGRNITAEQVLAHCSRDLEPLLVPRHVILMPELPKTATGKIDKSALKHMELEENR